MFLKKSIYFFKTFSFLGIFRYRFQPGVPILLTLTISKMSQNNPNLGHFGYGQGQQNWYPWLNSVAKNAKK